MFWDKRADLSRRLYALAIAIGLAVPCVTAVDIWRDLADTTSDAETSVENLSRSLEEHALRTFEAGELYLRIATEAIEAVRSEEARDAVLGVLDARAGNLQHISAVTITDARGLQLRAAPGAEPAVSFADRSYFVAHRDDPGLGTRIDRPMIGRLTGQRVIPISRRINAPDGSFAGVVVLSVNFEAFRSFYASLDVGREGSFTLFRMDGALLVRQPFDPALLARNFGNGSIIRMARQKPSAVIWAAPATDGVQRVIAYRTVPKYGLLVSAALSREEVLQPWRRMAALQAGVGLAMTALLAGLLVLFARSARQARASERMAEAAMERAVRAGKAKADFLAVMSHEIRTPLNSIIGYSGLLLEGPLAPEQAKHVGHVRDAGNMLLSVVNDVLDFSKVENGGIEYERIAFDLRALTLGVVEGLRPLARSRGLTLDVAFAEEVPGFVAGDPARIRQVLVNLVGNAIKFTPSGGIRISAAPAPEQGPGRLRVEVADSGIGIPADKLPLVFDLFTQVETSTTRRFGGTGLGLAICRRFVEGMGGAIGASSEPGAGSTFWFELPLPAAEAPTRAPEAYDAPVGAEALTILVVDDIALNRELVASLLSGAGHTIHMAENGAEAVQRVETRRYDVVLMDVHMPVMDGYEATRAIRALGSEAREVPILALTADVLPSSVSRCREAGMNDHVAKPVSRASLARAIQAQVSAPASGIEADLLDDMPPSLRRLFAADLVVRLDALEAGGVSRSELGAQAHRLVSVAGQLGLTALSNACSALDEACHLADGPDPEPLRLAVIEQARAELPRLRARIAALEQAA